MQKISTRAFFVDYFFQVSKCSTSSPKAQQMFFRTISSYALFLALFTIGSFVHIGPALAYAAAFLCLLRLFPIGKNTLVFACVATPFLLFSDLLLTNYAGKIYWIGGPFVAYTPLHVVLTWFCRIVLVAEMADFSVLFEGLAFLLHAAFAVALQVLAAKAKLWYYVNNLQDYNVLPLVPIYAIALELITLVLLRFFSATSAKHGGSAIFVAIHAIVFGVASCAAGLLVQKYK